MGSLLLAVLIVSVLAVQVGWHCKTIRGDFAARGLRVDRIRWRPIERLFGPWTRRQMLYRVWYADRSGEAFTCLAVVTIFEGFTIEEIRRNANTQPTSLGIHMKLQGFPWLTLVASAISCLAIGLTYWSVPYRDAEVPGALIGPGLFLLIAASAALRFLEPRRWWITFFVLALAPITAVCVRIATDVTRDPTSHNLFPFELVIAAFFSAVTVGIGMGVGSLLRRVSPARP
jgi:hypothetical protein